MATCLTNAPFSVSFVANKSERVHNLNMELPNLNVGAPLPPQAAAAQVFARPFLYARSGTESGLCLVFAIASGLSAPLRNV
jgi:hypothetical protein